MDRKSVYLSWIKDALASLQGFQDRRANSPTRGCFFYPCWRGKEKYSNARWQEAVFTLAWIWQREKDEELKERVIEGIDFWCRLQNRDGSFPEYCRGDRSFSATAFSTYAVLKTMEIVGKEDRWLRSLNRAGRWLSRNEERCLANQEAMAALTLLTLYGSLEKVEFLRAAEKKLGGVFKLFSGEGFFRESNGFDLGYSSLTLSILGNYYRERKDERIRKAAEKCISLMAKFIYPDGSLGGTYNSRQLGWVILDGLEIFSSRIEEAQRVLSRLLRGHLAGVGNLAHLPGPRHLCTDLYRLCQAYDHASVELAEEGASIGSCERGREVFSEAGLEIVRTEKYIAVTDINNRCLYSLWTTDGLKMFFNGRGKRGEKILHYLRPLGLHRFRGMKRFLTLAGGPKASRRYEFSEEEIKVRVAGEKEAFLFAYREPYVVEKEKSRVVLKARKNTFTICTEDCLELEDMGKISVEDSLFYGDRALGFLRIGMESSSRRGLEYVLKIA